MKKEIEVKIELTQDEFQKLAGDLNDFQFEKTFGYFKEDLSNIKDGIFPRIKYVEGKKKEIIFTVKRKGSDNSEFFEREETEIKLPGEILDDLREIIKYLGFSKEIIFEKKRKNIVKDGVVISLDKLPFGFFAEFEGEPELIRKSLKELGLSNKPKITKSYLGLWEEYKKTNGIIEENCTFK